MNWSDTIVACITGLDKAAVAVVRLSGPEAWEIASQVFSPWPESVLPRHVHFGQYAHEDDGLALPFEEGHSYTGEQTVELSIHGSPASVRSLIESCILKGARLAEPGEFTLRAFMSGRLDLTQAEGVRDTVDAVTEAQLRAANSLRGGKLRDEISVIRNVLLALLAEIDATTDFSEEIGDLDRPRASGRLQNALGRIDDLLKTSDAGRLVRQGLTIAIAGLPNAGKSSLLNAVLGTDRAIVAETPGTTRDTVEESAEIGGILCRLIDTAGLRAAPEAVERFGVERAHRAIEEADLVWYVYDASRGWTVEDDRMKEAISRPSQTIANKCDLQPAPGRGIPISAKTGQGLESLLSTVKGSTDGLERANVGYINRRHEPLIQEARKGTLLALATLEADLPFDLAVVGLQSAIAALGEITGETASADVIERIFHDFCVGK